MPLLKRKYVKGLIQFFIKERETTYHIKKKNKYPEIYLFPTYFYKSAVETFVLKNTSGKLWLGLHKLHTMRSGIANKGYKTNIIGGF